MTNTERKLKEANFFLKQLSPDYVYFDYILSAFLNSARSTTWIMRNEFSNINGWEKWFKECEISDEEKKLLSDTNSLRIDSAKKTGIKTDYFLLEGLVLDEEYYNQVEPMFKNLNVGEVLITLSDEDMDEEENESDFNETSLQDDINETGSDKPREF